MPDAKPTTRPSASATNVLVVFGAAVRTRSQSALLSSTFIAARYASGIMPRYVVRQASTRTVRDREGVGRRGGADGGFVHFIDSDEDLPALACC